MPATATPGIMVPAGQDMEAIHAQVRADLGTPIAEGRARVHRASSAAVLPGLPDEVFDLVYGDGDHLCEAVLHDLTLGFAKLRVGGLLLADDYGSNPKFWWGDGVMRAVHDFLADHPEQAVRRQSLRGRAYIQRLA